MAPGIIGVLSLVCIFALSAPTARANNVGISITNANFSMVVGSVQIGPETIVLVSAMLDTVGVVTKHLVWIGTSANSSNGMLTIRFLVPICMFHSNS
jgi:hypothetical protein